VLPEAGSFLTFAYYALAGTVWILPDGLMLPWMHANRSETLRRVPNESKNCHARL